MLERSLLLVPMTAFLIGCGSTPLVKLPSETDGVPSKLRVKLETRSQILVVHRLEGNRRCEDTKDWMRVAITPRSGGDKPTVVAACGLIAKTVVLQSKEYLPVGEYDVLVESSRNHFEGKPLVTMNPLDPEAKSGPDQDFGGAVELGENQTSKGAVAFVEANATNWIGVKGKGDVALFFIPESPADVQAKLFWLAKGAKSPRRLGTLPPKTKKHVSVRDGVLYVQISGKRYTGESPYALTRRDTPVTKSVSIAVIDCYPINANSSVVLLKPSEALKVNDELRVSARRGSSGSIALGKCVVTSISESQVSCRLDAVAAPDLGGFRAELVKEEGAT